MIYFLLLIATIVFFLAIYYFFFVKRIVSIFTNKKALSRVLALVIMLALGGLAIFFLRYTAVILMLHLMVAGLICQLISFILKKTVKSQKFQKKRDLIYKSGIIPIFVAIFVGVFGYLNMTNVIKTEYNYKSDKLSDDIKVAMISDLHMGTTMDTTTLKEHMDKISEENPDVFLLVGDIVDEGTTKDEMIKTFQILSDVKTNYGIYYVYGNHDRNIYGNHTNFTDDELTQTIIDSGIKVLKDDVVNLNGYSIIGRDDRSAENEVYARADINSLIEKTNSDNYIINLDHQPRELKDCAKAGVDLQLSGHTHGGQIWPVGFIAEKAGIFELSYGEKFIDNYTAITSSGIASWGYPIRTEQHSEYVIINVKSEK